VAWLAAHICGHVILNASLLLINTLLDRSAQWYGCSRMQIVAGTQVHNMKACYPSMLDAPPTSSSPMLTRLRCPPLMPRFSTLPTCEDRQPGGAKACQPPRQQGYELVQT
jgi:hypothetical protein